MHKRLIGGYFLIIIILFNSGCSQFKEYKHVCILELSIPDLIISLSDYSSNSDFRSAISDANEAQLTSSDDFITLFAEAWHTQVAYQESPTQLWRIFHNMDNHDLFPAKSTDEEIIEILASEAKTAINNTESIITNRILNNYTYQNRINYKINQLPNYKLEIITSAIKDKNNFRKLLVSTGTIEFWPTYFNDEIIARIYEANAAVGAVYYPELFGKDAPADSTLTPDEGRKMNPLLAMLMLELDRRGAIVGYAHANDTSEVNTILKHPAAKKHFKSDLRLMWEAKPISANHQIHALIGIKDDSKKGKAPLNGNSIVNSRESYNEIGDVVLNLQMDDEGTGIWQLMTYECAMQNNRSVAIVLDNLVLSAPSVRSSITNGRCQLAFGSSQNRNEKLERAKDISGFLKSGSLPARCIILGEWEYEDYVSESF